MNERTAMAGVGGLVSLGLLSLLAAGDRRVVSFAAFAATLLLLPVAAVTPLLVGLNVLGTRDALFEYLGSIPGFRSGGRWRATVGATVYVLLAVMVVWAVSVAATPQRPWFESTSCPPTLQVSPLDDEPTVDEDRVARYEDLTTRQQAAFDRALEDGSTEAGAWPDVAVVRYRGQNYSTAVAMC